MYDLFMRNELVQLLLYYSIFFIFIKTVKHIIQQSHARKKMGFMSACGFKAEFCAVAKILS